MIFFNVLHPSGYLLTTRPYVNLQTAEYKAKRCGGRVVTYQAHPVGCTKPVPKEGPLTHGHVDELKSKFPEAFQ